MKTLAILSSLLFAAPAFAQSATPSQSELETAYALCLKHRHTMENGTGVYYDNFYDGCFDIEAARGKPVDDLNAARKAEQDQINDISGRLRK